MRISATILVCATAVALGVLTATGALAQDKPVHLRLSSWVPPAHPLNPALEAWAKSVQADSHGSITFTLYPSEQLGKAFDHYDMARDGIADFAYVSPGYQPGRFPIIAAGSLPFLMANAHGGTSALDAWYRKYAPIEMGDVHFCFAFTHDPGGFHSREKKILVPADVRGLKVRPATDTIGNFVTLLGGTNVQASAPEARDMMAKGVADAITFPWGSMLLFGIDKVTKEHLDIPFYTTPFVWVMNKGIYDRMSAGQKKVIDDHCTTEWAEKVAAPWADFELAGHAKLAAEPGQDVYKASPEQVDEWRKAAEPLTATWAKAAAAKGIDANAALTELKASFVKYHAAF